jgi:hypothetical protein
MDNPSSLSSQRVALLQCMADTRVSFKEREPVSGAADVHEHFLELRPPDEPCTCTAARHRVGYMQAVKEGRMSL